MRMVGIYHKSDEAVFYTHFYWKKEYTNFGNKALKYEKYSRCVETCIYTRCVQRART